MLAMGKNGFGNGVPFLVEPPGGNKGFRYVLRNIGSNSGRSPAALPYLDAFRLHIALAITTAHRPPDMARDVHLKEAMRCYMQMPVLWIRRMRLRNGNIRQVFASRLPIQRHKTTVVAPRGIMESFPLLARFGLKTHRRVLGYHRLQLVY